MTSLPHESPKVWRAGPLVYSTGALALLFCWLLCGDFAWSMRDRCIPPAIQLLFKRFGASDTLVGILFSSLPCAIGLVVGPIISYRSDRLRSRWGRRIPFLLVPTPIIVLSIVGLAFSPQLGTFVSPLIKGFSPDPRFTTLVILAIFWSLFETACVAANSIFGALVNDIVPPIVLGRFFGLFRALSLIAGIFVNYWVMGKVETDYVWIFLAVGLVYGVGFTLMCLKVKEPSYPPPEEQKSTAPFSGVLTYFRDCFSRPYYLLVFIAPLFCLLSTTPFNIYSLFYAKSLGMTDDFYFKCLAVTYGVSLLLSYPLGIIVDRFHALPVSLIVTTLYGVVMACGVWWVRNPLSFAVIFIAHGVVAGSYFTTSASISQRLLPKLKFAELGSAGGILCNLAGMICPVMLGILLDHTHHTYRYVFHVGWGLAMVGVLLGLVLYRRFLGLGGPDHYVAPE